jgi:hypothetical protein
MDRRSWHHLGQPLDRSASLVEVIRGLARDRPIVRFHRYSAAGCVTDIGAPQASQNRAPARGSMPHVRHVTAAVIGPPMYPVLLN